mmetsp:Transcript_439/g.683  ORF Transcript_439/g.683 Transcript_439/m.683 type:complete len:136 (-) Transcript_439:349-756(-)
MKKNYAAKAGARRSTRSTVPRLSVVHPLSTYLPMCGTTCLPPSAANATRSRSTWRATARRTQAFPTDVRPITDELVVGAPAAFQGPSLAATHDPLAEDHQSPHGHDGGRAPYAYQPPRGGSPLAVPRVLGRLVHY